MLLSRKRRSHARKTCEAGRLNLLFKKGMPPVLAAVLPDVAFPLHPNRRKCLMKLRIEITGQLERIIVTSLPERFINKIFRHCLGKNNTPYFANNCFKGVLYFDWELAVKFAESVDFAWTTWKEATPIHKTEGYLFEQYVDIMASMDGDRKVPLSASELETQNNALPLDAALEAIPDDHICILLGAIDKGSESYTLEIENHFDPSKLLFSLDSLEDFKMSDMLITGVSYDGAPMQREAGKHIGKQMVMPVMFSKEGVELDLYDFMSMNLE